MICKYNAAIKTKFKKQFPHLLILQTSVDAIVRFTNMKKDEDMQKIASKGELLQVEFMVHDK